MNNKIIANQLIFVILATATIGAYAHRSCHPHKHYKPHKHHRVVHCRRPACAPACATAYPSCGYSSWNPIYPAQGLPPCNGNCGTWHPDRWRPYDEGYYYTEPDVACGPSYNPDLSTGDDDASIDPEMDIDK